MAPSRLLFFFCSAFLHLVAATMAQNTALYNVCSSNQGNFTTNSTYQSNLNHLLSSLSSNSKIDYGFYNASYGQNDNQVNAMALCRGDVKPDSCRSCISDSTHELPKRCPNQKEAIIWYDYCMLRYSDRYFFGDMAFEPRFWMYNLKNVSDANNFNHAVKTLLDSLKNQAASGDSRRKFATGNASTPKSGTIYALVQCTPDLTEQGCRDCLNKATALLPKCCDRRIGGRVIAPSCNFRYEIGPFYGVTADAPTISLSPSPSPTTSPSPSVSPSPPPSGASPLPATSPPPPPTPTAQPPESQNESPPPSPATSPPPPLTPTAQPSASQDESPPPPPSASAPPNSGSRKGNVGHDTSLFVLVLVPLLVSEYLSSVTAYF